MKKYNKETKQFEDYSEDLIEKELRKRLEEAKVPARYNPIKGLRIEDEDLTKANLIKDNLIAELEK
jgi:hypothetical protein